MPATPRRPRPGAPSSRSSSVASAISSKSSPRRRRSLVPASQIEDAWRERSPRSPRSLLLEPLRNSESSPSGNNAWKIRRRAATERIREGPERVELSPLRYSPRHRDLNNKSSGTPQSSMPSRQSSTAPDYSESDPYRRPPIEILKMLHNSMKSKQTASTDIVKLFNDWDVGDGEIVPGMGMARGGTNGIGSPNGFGDKSLSDKEMRQGLNFLLNTKLGDKDSRRLISMIDQDGDGEINVREFLDVALSAKTAEQIRLHDWRKRRHLIPEEKRKLIEARRHLAKPPRFKTGRVHPDDTAHSKMLVESRRHPVHRATFNQPERVLDLLRKRVTVPKMVSTFHNMDTGGVGAGLAESKLGKGTAHNLLLEPAELAAGINKTINMELDAEEVLNVLKVIDQDGDGTCSFGEFVEALRGDKIQNFIDARLKSRPSHNVAKREILKAREVAAKVGSRAERGILRKKSPRNGLEESTSGSDTAVSMIARLAVRDLDQRRRPNEELNIGWAGPSSITSARGSVGWTGAKKRTGPQIGPISEHTIRQHRDNKWRRPEHHDMKVGIQLEETLDNPFVKTSTRKYHSTRPHRGPMAFSPRSQLNFAFDHEATINERMKEIREIADTHRRKAERRSKHPRKFMYDGGVRIIRE